MSKLILKIFIAVVLIAIIAGISLIKSNLKANLDSKNIQDIKKQYFQTRDSLLLKQLDDSTRVYIDSIQTLEKYYEYQIDNLNRLYAANESLLTAELKSKEQALKDAREKSTQPKIQPPVQKPKTVDISKKVKDDYERLIFMLPEDLTRYELKVSINEIIIELSQKYKISPDSVKTILTS